MIEKKPKVFVMGKEMDWDDLPDPGAAHPDDYFAPVSLSPVAIDKASQIVPEEHWKGAGLYTWLSQRANKAFSTLPVNAREIKMGKLKYLFEYSAEGPVLKTVSLCL